MPRLPEPPTEIAMASFRVLEGTGAGAAAVDVQFNPASLEYTLSNEFDDSKGNNSTRQFVKKTSGKLTMTLIYDSTDTGEDIRNKTEKISGLLQPAKAGGKKFAPKVEFAWGAYRFAGVVEQYKETIDFFAASGVPLRASINLTLSAQEVVFQSAKNPPARVDQGLDDEPVAAPAGASPSQLASQVGDPRAARGIAGANGAASLRFGAEAGLSVGGGVSLSAAAGFAISGGVGLGASAGLSAGAGAGAGLSLGGGAGLSLTATAGPAFGGLRTGTATALPSVAEARASLLPAPTTAAAGFGPGGRAGIGAKASLGADVGAATEFNSGADLHAALRFD